MSAGFVTIGKGRKKRVINIKNKKKKQGVKVKSVSLTPEAETKIKKEQIQLLNKGETANFSKALNAIVIRKKRISKPLKPILEGELVDILEDITGTNDPNGELNPKLAEKVARESIKQILVNKNKWNKGYSVIVEEVELRKDSPVEGGYYQYDYQLLKDNKKINLAGTAYGSVSHGDMIDMTLELYNERL